MTPPRVWMRKSDAKLGVGRYIFGKWIWFSGREMLTGKRDFIDLGEL